MAPNPLFKFVSESVFQRRTYGLLVALLDNYKARTGEAEHFSQQQLGEQQAFLDAVVQSQPMQYAWQCLIAKVTKRFARLSKPALSRPLSQLTD